MASARAPPSREPAGDDDDDAQADAAHGLRSHALTAPVPLRPFPSYAPVAQVVLHADRLCEAVEGGPGEVEPGGAEPGAQNKGPLVIAALGLPVLPADVLRAIWQAKWRAEAACVVHCSKRGALAPIGEAAVRSCTTCCAPISPDMGLAQVL